MGDRYAWMPFPFRLTAGLLGDTKRTLQPDKPHRDPCWYMVCQTTSRFCRGLQLPLKAESSRLADFMRYLAGIAMGKKFFACVGFQQWARPPRHIDCCGTMKRAQVFLTNLRSTAIAISSAWVRAFSLPRRAAQVVAIVLYETPTSSPISDRLLPLSEGGEFLDRAVRGHVMPHHCCDRSDGRSVRPCVVAKRCRHLPQF